MKRKHRDIVMLGSPPTIGTVLALVASQDPLSAELVNPMLNAPIFQRVSSLLLSATETHYYSKMNQLMVCPEATTDRRRKALATQVVVSGKCCYVQPCFPLLTQRPPCVTSDRNEITIVLQHLDNDIASGKVKENRIAQGSRWIRQAVAPLLIQGYGSTHVC